MSLERMNEKMMRKYLKDNRIDIGKPEYEEDSFLRRFTLYFKDESISFRNSIADLYENCIDSAAYSGTGPHYEITGVHGSRNRFDGMYSRMEESQKKVILGYDTWHTSQDIHRIVFYSHRDDFQV